MHRQQLKNPPLSAIAGIGAVVLLVAALLLDSMLANLLARYIGGTAAKILFWLTGALIALIALKRYVLQYEYELANGMLSLNFRYGRYVRSVQPDGSLPAVTCYFDHAKGTGSYLITQVWTVTCDEGNETYYARDGRLYQRADDALVQLPYAAE